MRGVVDVLDACRLRKPRRASAGLKGLRPPQRHLMLKQQAEPLGVFEGACLGVGPDLFVALGHAVQAKCVKKFERWVGEHEGSPSINGSSGSRVRWDGRSPPRSRAGAGHDRGWLPGWKRR